ncbi:MAG: hypothetical protein BWZ02_02096 [Lentisphaerae bacterium ADurb.BinA184]|nr:MAG: hypothetical protein BWZ02_02096 [Lentisphaerae bacterium ADurb.BinA184]
MDSTWDANQAQLWFDRNASYSFTGGVTVEEGCHVYYKPSTAGTYSLGTGQIHIKDVAGGQTTSINYEPTVTGTTLTTPIHAQSGTTTFNWGNAPTFTGNLTLDSNIFFNSVGGAGEYFDWNGNVILTGDRTIIGGVRDLGPGRTGGLHFGGQFQGADHTLTLDFQSTIGGGGGLGMQAMLDTTAWDVGNLVLTNGAGGLAFGGGNTPNLLVHTTNATDDHFAQLRANGGKVTIQNGAQLFLRKGTIDFADLQSDATGKVLLDEYNAAYDVRLSGSGMVLGSAPGQVQRAIIGNSTGALGQLRGDITVGNGGTLFLTGQYNEMVKQYVNPAIANSGNLRLLGGGVLESHWGVGITHLQLNSGYEFQSGTQKLYLGDGNAATAETITFRGIEDRSTGAATGTFFFGTDNANVVDDGNVVLRYEGLAGTGDFNIGWSTLANITSMGYNSGTISYPFRGGSAGTEFAPISADNSIGAIGQTTGTVFTATSPTSLVTTGTVGFYNSTVSGPGGHRGAAGAVVIDAGGTFDLVAAGRAVASQITVQNGGVISGIGTFSTPLLQVTNGTVEPGNDIGTLYVDGAMTLADNSVLNFEFDTTTCDKIVVTGTPGTVTVDGILNILGAPTMGTVYTLFSSTGTLTDNILEPGVRPSGGRITLWTEAAGGYTNLNMLWIPEPTTGLILILGAALAARRRPAARA